MYRPIAIADRHYGANVLKALFAAAALHLLVFLLIPPFEFIPYRMGHDPLALVEMEPVPIALDAPEEIAQPRIAPPVVDDGPGTETFEIVFPKNIPIDINDIVPTLPHEMKRFHEYNAYDRAPVLVGVVRAEYPKLAWMAGIEGTVLFKVLVGADGRVAGISVISSSVTREMEKAAMRAVSQFVFEPALQGVVPVPATMRVPYTFSLR